MQLFWLVATFILGAIVGSFLNVCIYRLPRDKSLIHPSRSYCPHCHEQIAWYDNIPLLSYFALHAQCRHCGSPISSRYVIVEALTAVLFAATYWLTHAHNEVVGVTVVYLALTAVLIAASFMDLELRIIPNAITLGGTFLAPILSVIVFQLHDKPEMGRRFLFARQDILLGPLAACMVGMIVGAFLTWGSGVLGKFIFRREAMGLGDVKLMAMLGGLLGWQQVTMLFFVAALIGAVIGIIHILRTKEHHMPFGPFLSIAAFITMHASDKILNAFFPLSAGVP
jgi:leader peptidase (prepilin peptidase)/N-methyltransferase